jgi:hypothetical protein
VDTHFFHSTVPPQHGLVDAITPDQIPAAVVARLLLSDGGAMGTSRTYPSFELN